MKGVLRKGKKSMREKRRAMSAHNITPRKNKDQHDVVDGDYDDETKVVDKRTGKVCSMGGHLKGRGNLRRASWADSWELSAADGREGGAKK